MRITHKKDLVIFDVCFLTGLTRTNGQAGASSFRDSAGHPAVTDPGA